MSIQPAPQGEKWKFRINEYNKRTIERKRNRRGGRWQPFQVCVSEENAVRIILKLQKEQDADNE